MLHINAIIVSIMSLFSVPPENDLEQLWCEIVLGQDYWSSIVIAYYATKH